MYLQFSTEVISWSYLKAKPLFRLRGAPEELTGMRRFASGLLRIAHPQMVFLRCLDLDIEPGRLMDVLRISDEEIACLSATNLPLFTALTEKKPPTNWIRNPSGEIPEVFVKAAMRLDPEELETIEVTKEKLKPLDWLIDTALDTSQYFPEAITLRKMFGKKLPCADGESHEGQSER